MALYVNRREFFPLQFTFTPTCVHMHFLEMSAPLHMHAKRPHVCFAQAKRYTQWDRSKIHLHSTRIFFFPAAGRLVFVSDWEPREVEGETEEKRRFLAVSPLSSIALWLSWSSPVWSTSTVRSSSSNDKQLRLWSQSQKIAFSSFTFSSLLAVVWNLFNRSWTFPNMTQKNLELILLKNRPDYIIGENQWIN